MWFFDQTGLRRQELRTAAKLRSAIQNARRNTLNCREQLQLLNLLRLDGRWLNAVSAQGRIRWGQAFCQEFSDYFELGPDKPEPDRPIFLVTLCDRRCCTSHDTDPDIREFVRILRRGLRGLSYIGMLEPALYVNLSPGVHELGKRLVSWHVHLLAWGESQRRIERRIEKLNQSSLLPIADGLPAAHQKKISKGKLTSKMAYILKAPQKAYRLCKWEEITADGEVVSRFKQWKDELRPGERLTLVRLMKDLNLDQLALAGGEGTSSLRRLRHWVHRELRG